MLNCLGSWRHCLALTKDTVLACFTQALLLRDVQFNAHAQGMLLNWQPSALAPLDACVSGLERSL